MAKTDRMKDLIQTAIEARKNAYAPYSNYQVGAALITEDGEVFTGANVENAVYPLTICAERVAVVKAVTAGKKNIKAVVVVTADGGSPCGSCRQVMAEFGLDAEVIIADAEGKIHQETTVKKLLPFAFGPENLGR